MSTQLAPPRPGADALQLEAPQVIPFAIDPGGTWATRPRRPAMSIGLYNASPTSVRVSVGAAIPIIDVPAGAMIVLPITSDDLIELFTYVQPGIDGPEVTGLLFLFPTLEKLIWDVPVTSATLVNGTFFADDLSTDVGTSSELVAPLNVSRRGLQVVNDGANDVYLALGDFAEVGGGLYLIAGGGSWDGRIGETTWMGDVAAIANLGASHLTILETR